MKYDKTILDSLRKACESLRQREVAKIMGVSESTISQIFSGRVKGCKDGTWERLWPVLVEHGDLTKCPTYWPRKHLVAYVINKKREDAANAKA